MAVAVQIRGGYRKGLSHTQAVADRCLEGAVAVPQQHAHDHTAAVGCALAIVSHDQIPMAVAVHVCDRDGSSVNPSRVVTDGRLESTVTVAQEHSDAAIV